MAILSDFGIDCYVVDGDSHAWNMVCMDCEYYELDCTWDMATMAEDNKTSHKYFNKTTSYMTSTDHTREALSLKLPQAEGTLYTYEKVLDDMGILIGNHTINGIKYKILDGMEATVLGMANSKKALTLKPSVTYGAYSYKILYIEDDAFKNSKITKITLPESLELIGERAFKGCKNLKTVIIKNASKLDFILADAFKGAAKKITFKIHGSKKDFNAIKNSLQMAGVKKGIYVRV